MPKCQENSRLSLRFNWTILEPQYQSYEAGLDMHLKNTRRYRKYIINSFSILKTITVFCVTLKYIIWWFEDINV